MSNLQTRGASIGWDFEKPKLLIFRFLVRTNNEGVSALFCLAGEAGLPETVGTVGTVMDRAYRQRERGWILEQFWSHSRNATFLADVLGTSHQAK